MAMTFDDLTDLITEQSTIVLNENLTYAQTSLFTDLAAFKDENGKIKIDETTISEIINSCVRTSMELSTLTTFIVLQKIGVVPSLAKLDYVKQS